MQDAPTAPQLLEAVAALLAGSVAGVVPRELRFQVLVAANVCAIVAREIEAGPEPELVDRELFARLAGSAQEQDGRALLAASAARIRAGQFDEGLPELARELEGHVRRKLAVVRPGYDA